jgi:uncharacterized protein
MSYLLIFLLGCIAFTLSAICGGGASLLMIPFLNRWMPIVTVPAALSIGTFSSSGTRLLLFKQHIRWKIVQLFLPAAIPAVMLGAWLLKYINPLYLEIIMGFFLLSNLPFLFRSPSESKSQQAPKQFVLPIVGFLAGFLSGLTGAVGLLFNRFYFRYGLNKEEIIATRAANEILLHLVKFILYACLGLLSLNVLWTGLTIALSAVCSSFIVKNVLPFFSELAFRRIGYGAMVFSGLLLLAQSGETLFTLNKAEMRSIISTDGLETKLKWQNANYTLEFSYDEGFIFEQVIPFEELPSSKKAIVTSQKADADKIIIEVVYKIGPASYEAYFFKHGKFIRQIEFD